MSTNTFREGLEKYIDEHLLEIGFEAEFPVAIDFVLVLACDDAASPDGGGHYMTSKRDSHTYRTRGMLHHGLHMLDEKQDE